MIRFIAAVALAASIMTSAAGSNCPVPASYQPVKPGDWVWVNNYGWCKVVSVGEPRVVPDKPKAPKFDDKGKKVKEKQKPKAPKYDDK